MHLNVFPRSNSGWCARVGLVLASLAMTGCGGTHSSVGSTRSATSTAGAPGIYVSAGSYLSAESDTSIVTLESAGAISGTAANQLTILSSTEDQKGLYLTGAYSAYALSNAVMMLDGNGSNDFVGNGSGVMNDGSGTLTLTNVSITTNGCIRPTTTNTGDGTLYVYNSTLVANGGTLPDGYDTSKVGPGMMTPPSGLDIGGTCRASLTMGNGRSYFYNSTIISDGWGALSTDSATDNGVYLYAKDSTVKTVSYGYGAYADNRCTDVFEDCTFDTAQMSVIIAGDGNVTFTDTNAVSKGYHAMIHNVGGDATYVGTLSMSGGSATTASDLILIKTANAAISIDGSVLSSSGGYLIHSIVNDDANASQVGTTVVAGINATLANMTLSNSILHEDPDHVMTITLQGTSLKGALVSGASAGPICLILDSSSQWTATANSTVKLIGVTDASLLDAVSGSAITAVAGTGCTLTGTYTLASGGTLVVS